MATFAKRFGFGGQKKETPLPDITSSPDTSSTEEVKEKDPSAVTSGAEIAGRHFSEVEANTTLKQIKQKHQWDPNLPQDLEEEIDENVAEHNLAEELNLVNELVENSPYPEVRAVVRNVSGIYWAQSAP